MSDLQTPYFMGNGISDVSLMTVPELAEYLNIGKNRAYDLLNSGEIKAFRIGNVWKIPKESVDQFIYKKSGL